MDVSFVNLNLVFKLKGKNKKGKPKRIKAHFHNIQNNFFSILHETINKSNAKGCKIENGKLEIKSTVSQKQSKPIKNNEPFNIKTSSKIACVFENITSIKNAKSKFYLKKTDFNKSYESVHINEQHKNKNDANIQKQSYMKRNLNLIKNQNNEKYISINIKKINFIESSVLKKNIINSRSFDKKISTNEAVIDKYNISNSKVIDKVKENIVTKTQFKYSNHSKYKNINIELKDKAHNGKGVYKIYKGFSKYKINKLNLKNLNKLNIKSMKINNRGFWKVQKDKILDNNGMILLDNKNVSKLIILNIDKKPDDNFGILKNVKFKKENSDKISIKVNDMIDNNINNAPIYKLNEDIKLMDVESKSKSTLPKIKSDSIVKKKGKLDQLRHDHSYINKINKVDIKLNSDIKLENTREILYKNNTSIDNLNSRSNHKSIDLFLNENTKNVALISINEDKLRGSIKIITHSHDNVKIIFNVDNLLKDKIAQALPDLKYNLYDQGFTDVVFSFGDFLKHKKEGFKRPFYSGSNKKIEVGFPQFSSISLKGSLNFSSDAFSFLKDHSLNLLA